MCNNERDSFVLFEIGSDEGRDLHVGHIATVEEINDIFRFSFELYGKEFNWRCGKDSFAR